VTSDDNDRIERIAQTAVARWRHTIRPADHDDLLQEARLVVWAHLHMPDGQLVQLARWRTVDAMRRMWRSGRSHQFADARPAGLHPDGQPHHHDPTDPVLDRGLVGRHATIAYGLAAGLTKQAVAETLGVHPSRISQILPAIRNEMTDHDHD
jgi:hypothetical protein